MPERGFDLKARFDRAEVFGHFGRSGMHTPDDVFFADTRDDGRAARLRDTGRIVLEHFGLGDTQDRRGGIIL